MSNKTQLQTNNTALDGYIARINAAKEVAANLPDAGGSGGGSDENFETSIVTINTVAQCIYLGTDFQSKKEPTSTFETIKNSLVYINGRVVDGSGYTALRADMTTTVVQLTEPAVNITIAANGGAD
jgi:hypothetical protein